MYYVYLIVTWGLVFLLVIYSSDMPSCTDLRTPWRWTRTEAETCRSNFVQQVCVKYRISV